MTYESLEAAIVGRLQGLTSVAANVLPENDNEYTTPYTMADVVVAYNSSAFDDSQTSDLISQPETIHLQLVVRSRRLRGKSGIYQVLDALQGKLQGWRPPDCTKIHLLNVKFESHNADLWTYSMMISTEGFRIEQPDPETDILSTQISLKDETGTVNVDVTA